MDNLKFKVWDGNKMLYPGKDGYVTIGAVSWGFWKNYEDNENLHDLLACSDCDSHKLLPYTGYKDKNGAEIYKKDYLKATMITGKGIDLDRRKNVDLSTVYFEVDYIQGAFLLQGLNIHQNILVNSLFMDKNYYKERIRGSAHFKVEFEEGIYYRFDDFERVGSSLENPELLKEE